MNGDDDCVHATGLPFAVVVPFDEHAAERRPKMARAAMRWRPGRWSISSPFDRPYETKLLWLRSPVVRSTERRGSVSYSSGLRGCGQPTRCGTYRPFTGMSNMRFGTEVRP